MSFTLNIKYNVQGGLKGSSCTVAAVEEIMLFTKLGIMTVYIFLQKKKQFA